MSIHRYTIVFGVVGMVFGLGAAHVHAQAPPIDEAESYPATRADDAATEGLRSLYVPGGLTSDRAVKEVIETSPDMKRTRALLNEAKGGAMQAMSGLVPQLALLFSCSQ